MREAQNTQTVGTVGRDLDIDHFFSRMFFDRFHFTAGERQAFRQNLRGKRDVRIFFKPRERKFYLKLPQETHVVLEELPDVFDAVLEHGQAFDAHTECEARVLFRVYFHGLEDARVHHARAEDLQP